jgi:hypothetical protein
MGEVYRARDTALGRDVAIKVLPTEFASDPDRLRRFTQEAQAAAALNHPNILAIHHVGTEQGAPYIVSELLEGETLRDRLSAGALPVRKAVEYAIQVASGLASAHDKGIVHRDLKPENLFITHDGRVKILDFGLAKLTGGDGATVEDRKTVTAGTGAGMVLGTVGYMSPEQVRAQPVDARTDLFSLGAILYEMVSGRRTFHGETPADTMSAILKEEPEPLTVSTAGVPPALERVVRHCLEKNPFERFQSARDLKFDLSEIIATPSGASSATAQMSGITQPAPAQRRSRVGVIAALACVALAVAAGLGWVAHRTPASTQPTYQRLTFRRGTIATARFAPDRKTIVYGAAWDGGPPETFLVTTDSPEFAHARRPRQRHLRGVAVERAGAFVAAGRLAPTAGRDSRTRAAARWRRSAPGHGQRGVRRLGSQRHDGRHARYGRRRSPRVSGGDGALRGAGTHPPDSRFARRGHCRVLGGRPWRELRRRHRSKPPEAIAFRRMARRGRSRLDGERTADLVRGQVGGNGLGRLLGHDIRRASSAPQLTRPDHPPGSLARRACAGQPKYLADGDSLSAVRRRSGKRAVVARRILAGGPVGRWPVAVVQRGRRCRRQ